MATKRVGQAQAERILAGLPGRQGDLLPGGKPAWHYTGRPGRPKGRPNNKTLAALADLDNLGEVVLRERIGTALCDPVTEAERLVRRIFAVDPEAKLSEFHREKVAEFTLEMSKLREKARDGVAPFVLKKKPTEIDVTEKKVTEARIIVEDRRQLPGGVQTMIEGTAIAVDDDQQGAKR